MSKMTSSAAEAYRAAHEGAVVARVELAAIGFSGPDRKKTLQGLTSNDVHALKPGEGQASCVLTPKGKLVALFMLYDLGDRLLAVLRPQAAEPLKQALSKPLMLSQTILEDVSGRHETFGLFGPRSREVAASLGKDITVLPYPWYGVDGFWLLAPTGRSLAAAGALSADAQVLETLRVEAGIARYGAEADAESFPAELGLDGVAVSYSKGCYMGQEITARLKNLGHVNRRLCGVKTGGPAPAGAQIIHEGRPAGRLTSAVDSPRLGARLGLAVLPVGASAPGTRLEAVWDGGRASAETVAFPLS